MAAEFTAKASDLKSVITPLHESLPEISDILIADNQGLPMISTFKDQEQEARLAAMTAILAQTSRRAISEMQYGEMTNCIVTANDGYVYVREVTPDVYMALAVKPGVDWASLVPRINWAVLKIRDH